MTPQPPWTDVQYQNNWEGVNGDKTITEQSQNAEPVGGTFAGIGEITNLQAKFGSTSYRCDIPAANNQATWLDQPFTDLNANDFTWETQVRFSALVLDNDAFPAQCIVSKTNDFNGVIASNSYYWALFAVSPGQWELRFVGSNPTGTADVTVASFPWNPAINTWYHVAVVRNGTQCEMFVDGVSIGSNNGFATVPTIFDSVFTNLKFGISFLNSGGIYQLDGWLDATRLTIGPAFYTANFPPPMNPHPKPFSEGFDQSSYSLFDVTATPNDSRTAIVLQSNGDVFQSRINQTSNILGTWVTGAQFDINDYDFRFEPTSGSINWGPSDPVNTWVNGSATWGVEETGFGVQNCTGTLRIRLKNNPNEIDNCTVTLNAEST